MPFTTNEDDRVTGGELKLVKDVLDDVVTEEKALCGRCEVAVGDTIKLPSGKVVTPYCDECAEAVEQEEKEAEFKKDIEGWCRYIDRIKSDYPKHALRCGIPPRYHDISFDALTVDEEVKEAIELALKFAADPQGFLFLHGDTGRGKTSIAAAAAREIILSGEGLLFVRTIDFLNKVRKGFNSDKAVDVFDEFKQAPILILDDLGTEKWSAWVNEVVYDLIDYRYGYLKPTIVTSNLMASEISKLFGPRIASRLRHAGPVVKIGGPDRRLRR